MAASATHQDMPPEGGYKPINYARISARKFFTGTTLILGYLGVTAIASYVYFLTWKKVRRDEIEMRSARLALTPLLTAERDREFLKQLRRNRDEEAKLMANVPGWEVGTWFGDPIYKTLPPDTLIIPHVKEFYAHTPMSELLRKIDLKLWA